MYLHHMFLFCFSQLLYIIVDPRTVSMEPFQGPFGEEKLDWLRTGATWGPPKKGCCLWFNCWIPFRLPHQPHPHVLYNKDWQMDSAPMAQVMMPRLESLKKYLAGPVATLVGKLVELELTNFHETFEVWRVKRLAAWKLPLCGPESSPTSPVFAYDWYIYATTFSRMLG